MYCSITVALNVNGPLPHVDVIRILLKQPLLEFKNPIVECGKTLLLIVRCDFFRCDNVCNKKRLVDIDTAADGVYDFQVLPSLNKVSLRRRH